MFKRFSICYILLMFCITGTSAQEDRWTGNATNLSKGNLRVNSSGRYLEYSDGTPFLYIGDTAWELISRLNDKETELYLENRREKGFTVIQTVILDELDDMDVSSNGEPKLIDGNIDKPAPDSPALACAAAWDIVTKHIFKTCSSPDGLLENRFHK